MITVKASEFKAKCLKMIDEVAASGEGIVITKNGKPMARLVPDRQRPKQIFGALRHLTAAPLPDSDELLSAYTPEEWAGIEREWLKKWDRYFAGHKVHAARKAGKMKRGKAKKSVKPSSSPGKIRRMHQPEASI